MARARKRSAAAARPSARPPASRTPSAREPAAAEAPAELSPRRRLAFTAITLAVPFILLAFVELGLRVGGYGSSFPLFVRFEPEPAYLVPNKEVAKRYFRDATITPLPQLDFFRAERRPATFRLVFQGESSAAGFPYRHGGAPSRMLEQRLQATFPDRDIEVVNTALTAVNSYTLLDLADEIIGQRPDAVLIYTGHNEYYGVFGVGSTQSVGRWRPLIRAYLALHRLRTAQLLGSLLGGGARASAAAAEQWGESPRTVMELLAGEQRIPLGAPLYERGLAQFRANLRELLSRYRAHRVPVFIGTVASNERDQRPFVSAFGPGADTAAWGRSYRVGVAALARGDTAAAARALQQALRVDSTAADGLYAMARLADARRDTARARTYYRAAKEHDELRFRAPEAVNRIIREEAARAGATVVETERALERASGGVVGGTVMLEHLHPNLDGYFLIADAFYEALRLKGMIGPWTASVPRERARQEIPVTPVDSLVGLYRTDRLLSGWPFRPAGQQATPVVDTLHPATREQQLAQAIVRGTLPWADAMARLQRAYELAGDHAAALRVARAMAQEFRVAPEPNMDAARLAILVRRYDEAARYARAAYDRRESVNSARLAGLLLLRQGDQRGALRYLERAAQLAPTDERTLVPLQAARVLPDLEHARAQAPRDTSVLYQLAVSYAVTQQEEKAREVLRALRAVVPAHRGARELEARLPK